MGMNPIRTSSLVLLIASSVLAFQASADTVRLKSGQVIQNCTAVEKGNMLEITTAGTKISMPMSRVESVESAKVAQSLATNAETMTDSESLAARVHAMLPTAEEDRFLEIPWRTELFDARLEANEQGKPIFLWQMGGDPLGGT